MDKIYNQIINELKKDKNLHKVQIKISELEDDVVEYITIRLIKDKDEELKELREIIVNTVYIAIDRMTEENVIDFFADSEDSLRKMIFSLTKEERSKAYTELIKRCKKINIEARSEVVIFLPDEERMDFIKENASLLFEDDLMYMSNYITIFLDKDIEEFLEIIKGYVSNKYYEFAVAQAICWTKDKEKRISMSDKYVGDNKTVDPYSFFYSMRDVTNVLYELLDNYLSKSSNLDLEDLVDIIGEKIEKLDGKKLIEKYPNIVAAFAKEASIVNRENFEKFIIRFGSETLMYLNKNIVSIINLGKNDFEKIMDIFSKENMTLDRVATEALLTSIMQRKFRVEKSEIYNIFHSFERWMLKKDKENIDKCLRKIDSISGINVLSKIKEEFNDYDDFLNKLTNKNGKAIEVLHSITNEFIKKEREKYCKENMEFVYSKLKFKKRFERKTAKKTFINEEETKKIAKKIKNMAKKPIELTQKEKMLLKDEELLLKVIEYKKSLNNGKQKADNKELLVWFDVLDDILDKLYEVRFFEKYYEEKYGKKCRPVEIQLEYIPVETKTKDVLEILSNINSSYLKKNLLDKEKTFEKLKKEYISKYKILGWNNNFDNVFKWADCSFDILTASNMINFFYVIEPKITNITSFIDYGNCYGLTSKKHNILFGKENSDLIAADAGRNKSSLTKQERFKEAVDALKLAYIKKKTTIYPLNEEIELSDKSIFVNVGNFTNPINLTYGERTDSCLRIGGAFEDLFDFCLVNPNGFHIRFTDSENGEFISRVTGIRNGNTIFLNQLRHSESDDYSDEDICNALKETSKILIERTKKSNCPIENVIITTDFAFDKEKYKIQEKNLGIDDLSEKLYNLNFNYKDSKGYVLCSVYPENEIEYKFGEENSEEYNVLDDNIVIESDKQKIYEAVCKTHIVDLLLKEVPLEYIDLSFVDEKISKFEPVKCIYGDSFYVIFDKKGKEEHFTLFNINRDKKKRIESKINELIATKKI